MNFIPKGLPISVENVEELIVTRTKDGGVMQTAGYVTAGDGGNNSYFYRQSGRSALPAIRGGFHIAGTGDDDYYEACDQTIINPRQYGSVGGKTQDATDIWANMSADSIDFAAPTPDGYVQVANVVIPNGIYRVRYWALPAPAQIRGEGFEASYLIAAPNAGTCDFTASAATDQFTTANFPWSVGRRVRFVQGTALPPEITAGRTYFVVETTFSEYTYDVDVSFKVSEVPGGVALALSGNGDGLAVHGSFITDRGNAAKLTPEALSVWGNKYSIVDGSSLSEGDSDYESPYVSAAWDLGPTPNKGYSGTQWGSGASMRNINTYFWHNAVAYEINQNICFMQRCWSERGGIGFRIRGNGWGSSHVQATGNRGVAFQFNRSHPFEVDYAVSPYVIWCDEPVPTVLQTVYFLGDDLPAGLTAQQPYYVRTDDLLTAFTVDTGADTILSASHGLSDGFRVYFAGANLPGGLSRQTKYFVVNANASDFQVSLTEGGAAVDITSAGSGTMQYFRMSFQISLVESGSAIDLLDNGSGDIRYSIYSTAAIDVQGGCLGVDAEVEAPFSYDSVIVDGSDQLQCNFSGMYFSLDNAGSEFTAVGATDLFTLGSAITGYTGITLADGTEVYLDGDDLPGGTIANRRYWMRDVSGSTFKLAATSGGAAVDISSDGSGTIAITPKPNNLVRWRKSAGSLTNPRVSPGARGYTNYGTFRSGDGSDQVIAIPESVGMSRVRHKGPLVADSLVLPYLNGYAVLTAEAGGIVRAARFQLNNWFADFNGIDTKITMGSTIALTKGGEYTYSWKCSVRTVNRILASHSVSNDSYLGYYVDATDMRHNSYNNSGPNYLSATLPVACNDGDMHHYILRRMPGNVFTVWQDGVECVTAIEGTLGENFGWIDMIGRRGVDPALWFDGQLDFFRAWDYGLTASEIAAEIAGSTPGALLSYEFTDAAGSSVKDFGSGMNIGTLSSGDISAVWVEDEELVMLTPIDNGAINSGDATTDGVIANNRTRIAEIAAALQAYGILE